MSCPATTLDFGEVVRCTLPAGHEGLHQGACIGWSSAIAEDAVAKARRHAYGVALEGLGVAFDPDASALTLLLQVQQETARARELGEAVAEYLSAFDAAGVADPPGTERLRELCPVMTLRDAFEAIAEGEP